jgi:hypothetical protein
MKRLAPALDYEALTAEIAGLLKLGIDELRERWKAMYVKAPSREIGRSFLTRAIAYRLQERLMVDSGLRPAACWFGSPKRPRLEARRRNPRFGRPNREPS